MKLVTVRSYPQGPRLWLLGQRVHHGATGVALAAVAISRRRRARWALLGALLALHDRHDWRVWFVREILEAAGSVTNVTDTELCGAYEVQARIQAKRPLPLLRTRVERPA